MTIVLILFGIALVVAVVVAARQALAQFRGAKAGLARFNRRFEEERLSASLPDRGRRAAKPGAAAPEPPKGDRPR